MILAGQITDDYGFSTLLLKYSYEGSENFKTVNIPIDKSLKNQTYYHVFRLDSSYMQAGGSVKYYLEVADNDAVNGSPKDLRRVNMRFKFPHRKN